MLLALGSKVSTSVQRSCPALKVTSQCDTVRFSDTSVMATFWTASQSTGYRSKAVRVSYTSLAGLCGTYKRRWTVRISISLAIQHCGTEVRRPEAWRETCLAAEVRARASRWRSAASRIAGGVRRSTLLELR